MLEKMEFFYFCWPSSYFLGLVLCVTHLSDITLTTASNVSHTFCFLSVSYTD